MLAFHCRVVKSDLILRINTNFTVIWYLTICPLLHLSYGPHGDSSTRIDLWKEKRLWLLKKRRSSTVLGILPNIHIMSVRICIKLLYRKQRETEASLHPSACAQHADKVLMRKSARTYKRIKDFESKPLRKNWFCEAFLLLLKQFRVYESLWKVLNWQTKFLS